MDATRKREWARWLAALAECETVLPTIVCQKAEELAAELHADAAQDEARLADGWTCARCGIAIDPDDEVQPPDPLDQLCFECYQATRYMTRLEQPIHDPRD